MHMINYVAQKINVNGTGWGGHISRLGKWGRQQSDKEGKCENCVDFKDFKQVLNFLRQIFLERSLLS